MIINNYFAYAVLLEEILYTEGSILLKY